MLLFFMFLFHFSVNQLCFVIFIWNIFFVYFHSFFSACTHLLNYVTIHTKTSLNTTVWDQSPFKKNRQYTIIFCPTSFSRIFPQTVCREKYLIFKCRQQYKQERNNSVLWLRGIMHLLFIILKQTITTQIKE